MPVVKHDYVKSPGLAAEIEAIDCHVQTIETFRSLSVDDFIGDFINTPHGIEFVNCVRSFSGALKILDIGAGQGQTSLYLAQQGHDVTAVEPSPHCCRIIELMAGKANATITVHECSIEALSFRDEFDVCIFNASFHHCEDPLLSAKNCYRALRKNGKIYLINEQALKFYRSKAAYVKNMKCNPGKVLHYGGNEHIYRNHEYRSFLLRAGFQIVGQHAPSYYLNPKALLKVSLNYKGIDGYEHSFPNIILRALWYYLLSVLTTNHIIAFFARELSLIGNTVIGEKK